MSRHYLIDGYNVIRSDRWPAEGDVRAQRARLARFIEERRPTGSERNRVTVVFDGHGDAHEIRTMFVEILFSGNGDADSVIKRQVDAMPSPGDAIVVTDDRAIQRWVKGAKARVMSCAEFISAGSGRSGGRRSEKPDAETARDINDELLRIWKDK